MQKKLWICLISSKNLYLKYRFFLLFRRVSNKPQLGLKMHRELPSGSLIFSPSLSNLPEKCTMSEWFCRFFSLRLSKFTQTSCAFQARGVPAEKPVARMAYPPRNPRALAVRGVPAEKPAHSKAQRARAHSQKEPGCRAIASGLWCV